MESGGCSCVKTENPGVGWVGRDPKDAPGTPDLAGFGFILGFSCGLFIY